MTHVYVCQFSNGIIKVGRSIDPHSRVANHIDRVSCVGIQLEESRVYACVSDAIYAERELIAYCSGNAISRIKSEWFDGLNFEDVCKKACELAQEHFPKLNVEVRKETKEFFAAHQIDQRYKYVNGVWHDSFPDIPHWPDSALMRWDLRKDDWHRIWPELITHPCAIFFATTHPFRDGAPSFKDWINSIPFEYFLTEDGDVERRKTLNLITNGAVTRKDLRPDDWERIWPELSEKEGV